MRFFNIPVFVPHIGCKYNCVFCNQKKITGKKDALDYAAVDCFIRQNLETIKKYSKGERYVEIAFFGGSFTAIDIDVQNALCSLAYKYVKSGEVNGIRCSTRPDAIDEECLCRLKKCGFTAIELGVQSTDDEVLKKSGRGHTSDVVFSSARLIKKHGFSLGLQMMLGLLGDTREKMLKTCDDIIGLKPDCVRVYPTLVIEETPLFNLMKKGEYEPLSLEFTVDVLSEILEKFYKNGINVIRVGLQTTDEVNEKTVKGPYHAAIREMAETLMYRKKIEKHILQNTSKSSENRINGEARENKADGEKLSKTEMIIFANSRDIAAVSGYKKENKKYLWEKYHTDLKVKTENSLKKGEIKIL